MIMAVSVMGNDRILYTHQHLTDSHTHLL